MKYFSFLMLVLCICAAPVSAQQFKAAAAVRNITPDPLLPVSGGIGPSHEVTQKKGELTARALVLEKADVRVAIVNVDNLGWPAALGDRSRKLIKSIPPENILIGATHTHSAPDAYGFPDETGKVVADMKYLDWCVQQIADAVNEAVANLQPAAIKVAMGEVAGQVSYNYYAPRLYDPRCGVMQAVDLKGKPIATLVNYAIHPEVIGSKRGILSPDLCGPLYDRIEKMGGGTAIFINGALGGMVTADNRREGGEVNTWEECIRIGHLLADNALKIVKDAEVIADPQLVCKSKRITFPVDNHVMRTIVKFSPLNYSGFEGDSMTTRVNFLRIGPAHALTIPGEALPNIGYYLKRKMKTQYPFLFGLTNDAFGYILTKVDFDSFERYEYVTRTSIGEMTGEIYIDTVLDWISSLND